MRKKASVAGVILTLNEEQNIARAIESLDWCDEVIVVDSGSSDSTRDMAKDLGARVYTRIQSDSFLISDQRNWSIQNCDISSTWILFLDADETIDGACAGEVQHRLEIARDEIGFYMAPRYMFLGKWLRYTQSFPVWHPRIVRHGEAMFTGGVWEEFKTTKNLGRISSPYDHDALSKGIDDWVIKHCRYAEWDAEKTMAYLKNMEVGALKTSRKWRARAIASRLWRVRPIGRWLEKYIWNKGYLDGWQGLLYSTLMGFFELIVVVKIIEKRRLLHASDR